MSTLRSKATLLAWGTLLAAAPAPYASVKPAPLGTAAKASNQAPAGVAATVRGLDLRLAGMRTDSASQRSLGSVDHPSDFALHELGLGLARFRTPAEPGALVQAVEHFHRATVADAGQLALGYALGVGLGIERDEARAQRLLLGLRGPYRSRGWYLLGLIDERSAAPKRNARAIDWFVCAARGGDGLAMNHLGALLERSGRWRDASRLYDAATRRGVREAVTNRERLREIARESDARSDLDRLRTQARRGDIDAMYMIARAFHRGLGVAADYTEALRWYALAAQKGHAEARRMWSMIVARPMNDASIDPPWMNSLSRQRVDVNSQITLRPSALPPLSASDPLFGLESLHLQSYVPTPCEVSP